MRAHVHTAPTAGTLTDDAVATSFRAWLDEGPSGADVRRRLKHYRGALFDRLLLVAIDAGHDVGGP